MVDEIVLKFESFANFDTVKDFTDHYYRKNKSAAMQVSTSTDAYLYRVIKSYYPTTLFVLYYT